MTCAECGYDYPDEILSQMNVNGRYTPPICGICALNISNRAMRENRTEFQGQMAETNRQLAILHRQKGQRK